MVGGVMLAMMMGSVGPVAAKAVTAATCINLIQNAKVPSAELSAAEYSPKLDAFKKAYDAAAACVASVSKAENDRLGTGRDLQKMAAKYEEAKAVLDAKRVAEPLAAEGGAIAGKLRDGADILAAVPEGQAYLERVRKAQQQNPKVSGLRQHVEHIQKLIESAPARAAAAAQKRELQTMQENTVTSKLAGYTAQDMYDDAKVAKAFAEAPPELFSVAAAKTNASSPALIYMPTPNHKPEDASVGYTPKPGEPSYTVTWVRGKAVVLFPNYEEAPAGTVVLRWSGDPQGRMAVVAQDGGIYWGRSVALKMGTAAEKAPAPMPFTSVAAGDIEWFEKAGVLKAGTGAKLEKAREVAAACNAKVWKAADPKFAKIAKANILESARQNRLSDLRVKIGNKASKTCAKQLKAVQKQVDAVVKQRVAARQKIAKPATARLAEVQKSGK